jgi:nucleoside-diphosphate-sugar epimerase
MTRWRSGPLDSGVGVCDVTGHFAKVQEAVCAKPRCFLVTDSAGFVGSHLLKRLLSLQQEVVILNDLSTSQRANLEELSEAPRIGEICYSLEDIGWAWELLGYSPAHQFDAGQADSVDLYLSEPAVLCGED